jgi:hypothetical protein
MTASLLILALLASQAVTPRLPARDQQRPATGTAVVRGFVVDGVSGNPVRRAVVIASSAEARATGYAVTDDEGRFEMREMAAGGWTFTVSRSGYLRTTHGRTRPLGPATIVQVADGQTIEKLVIPIMRGGVITGHVVNEYGEPAVSVEIRPMQYRYQNGVRSMQPTGGMGERTDDRGQFRLYGLEPGQYYVSAIPRVENLPVPPTLLDKFQLTGPAATYFPNTPDAASAQRITVAAGLETQGVNIVLVSTRLSRVRGRAVLSSGEPFAGAYVQVSSRQAGSSFGRPGGQVRPDGSFEVRDLTPGTYQLTVRPTNWRDGDGSEIARTTVTVAGEDVDNVMLIGGVPATARGRIVTDEGTALPMKAAEIRINTNPATPEDQSSGFTQAKVLDDLTFEMRGLFGHLLVRAFAGGEWMLKEVLWRGLDVTDSGIDFQPNRTFEDIDIVFTRKRSELTGTVIDDGGDKVLDTWIVAFPADERLWTPNSRFVRATRPDREGTYRFSGLPPYDNYLLVVAPEIEQGQWQDPDFLKDARERGTRVAITEAEQKIQNLRVGRPAP